MTDNFEYKSDKSDKNELNDICDECKKEDETVTQNLILTDINFVTPAEHLKLYFRFKYLYL